MMKWRHEHHDAPSIDTAQAIALGAPSQGGLYVPEHFPEPFAFSFNDEMSLAKFSENFLWPFFKGTVLENYLSDICHESFNFPIKLKPLNDEITILELFHGPTLSFKDFGARFFARCLSCLSTDKVRSVLVATSGDTGSAVASSFYQVPNTKVVILFPKGCVSQRQKKQICAFGGNISPLEVAGTFDDCQALVKSALNDNKLKSKLNLTTANSINIARVLAQMAYLAYSCYKHYHKTKSPVNLIIPSGNLGHVTAAFYAKIMQAPIAIITIATNANKAVSHYWNTGEDSTFPTIQTLANAMDVGAPSNLKRLIHLWHLFPELRQITRVSKVNDDEIQETIKAVYQTHSEIICPHTACGFQAHSQQGLNNTLIAATAHAAKFNDVIEDVLAQTPELPPNLESLLEKSQRYDCLHNDINQFKHYLGTI